MKRILTLALLISAALAAMIPSAAAEIIPPEGIDADFLAFTGIEGKTAVVLCESLSVCDERDGKTLITRGYGEVFITTEGFNGWANSYYNDGASIGWVRSDYILVDPAYYLTDESTPVYAYADAAAPRVALLGKGERLPIILDDGEWLTVSIRGAAGCIRKTPRDTAAESGFSPEKLANIECAELTVSNKVITLTDVSLLKSLSEMLTNVRDNGAATAGCPFEAELRVVVSGGEVITLLLATDSCCNYRISNRDYSYARNLWTPDTGVNNTVLFDLFGVKLW